MVPIERERLAARYLPKFTTALQMVLEVEVARIREILGVRKLALHDVYTTTVPRALTRYMSPLQWSYYQSIFTATENEIGVALEHKDSLDAITKRYIKVFQERYTESHGAQLEALTDVDEVTERLEEWLTTGAARRARDEVVRQGQSTFRESVVQNGFSVFWRVRSQPCNFCRQLDGIQTSGQTPFVERGTTLTAADEEGETIKMKIWHKTLSPSLHLGCQCYLSTT